MLSFAIYVDDVLLFQACLLVGVAGEGVAGQICGRPLDTTFPENMDHSSQYYKSYMGNSPDMRGQERAIRRLRELLTANAHLHCCMEWHADR